MAFFPEEALRRLQEAHEADRLAHAYLITGASGPGLTEFARTVAGLVLGLEEAEVEAHPDCHTVQPESKSRRILVDQMRELEGVLHQRPLLGSRKVAILWEADRMVEAGANAFLKTLEEPPSGTHLLLVSSLPEAMLTTIVSRCLELPLRLPAAGLRPREKAARDLAAELLDPAHPPGLAEIFLAVRHFQGLLSEAREEATDAAAAALKAEKDHYKDRTEAGAKWLEEQEAKLAARAEGEVVRERARLIEALSAEMAERLRVLVASNDVRIGRHESLRLLSRIDAVARLRANLQWNLNEALALEAGFLEIFSQP
jgi:DNA polymerase-3 subunit delta'